MRKRLKIVKLNTRVQFARHAMAAILAVAATLLLAPPALAIHCLAGKYDNNGTCTPCPLGSVNEGTATGDSTCHGCGFGEVPNQARTQCMKCPADRYADPSKGDLQCKKCAVGFSVNTTHSACTFTGCPGGMYLNGLQNVCKQCPIGSINEGPQTMAGACHGCGNGQIPNAAQNACLTCGPGKYANPSKGDLQCKTCPFGSQVNATHTGCVPVLNPSLLEGGKPKPKPVKCARGTVPNADGTACVARPEGGAPGILETTPGLGTTGPAGGGSPLGGGGARPGGAGAR